MNYGHRLVDVTYKADPPLLARLYIPECGFPPPILIDVHGGAWVSGDRFANVVIHEALAKAGIAVMAIDFRKPPSYRYPCSVADVHDAIRWLKTSASDFGLAGARFGGLGTSSGAHQLLLAVLRADDSRYGGAGTNSADLPLLDYLVLGWPVVDPLARYRMVLEQRNEPLINAHHAYWPDEASMEEGNPQLILQAPGPQLRLPSALVLQGGADTNLPADSADRFTAAYRLRGGNIRLQRFADEGHAFVIRSPASAASRAALELLVRFVVEQAGGGNAAA
jgi:acetyl esterase/lipase